MGTDGCIPDSFRHLGELRQVATEALGVVEGPDQCKLVRASLGLKTVTPQSKETVLVVAREPLLQSYEVKM